jgi:hypothetical protein
MKREELEVVLKGVIATLRDAADILDDLRKQKKSDGKLTKELSKALRPVLTAVFLLERCRGDLAAELPEFQPKAAGISTLKTAKGKMRAVKTCSECRLPHPNFQSCDEAVEEE